MKKFLAIICSLILSVFAFSYLPKTAVFADESVISIGELTVHFIDVGQGDACIIELPDNRTMLIDAGENTNKVKAKLDEYITTNIKDEDGNVIEYFDYAIMTHSDSDHIGSMAYVLERYHAKTLYRPNQECGYKNAKKGIDCIDHAYEGETERNRFWEKGHTARKDPTLAYHEALEAAYQYSDEVIVTNPYDDSQNKIESTNDEKYEINFYSPLSYTYSDVNNYSPIIVITYMGRNIVLTGDAETKNEEEFVGAVNAGTNPRYAVFNSTFCADVIKLGHHGSGTSSTEDYLNVVTKSNRRSGVFVVISCGAGNKYHHPNTEVLDRLNDFGFSSDNILRTDQKGDIVISVTQVDGEYKAVYNGKTGGSTDNVPGQSTPPADTDPKEPGQSSPSPKETDPISAIIEIFNGLNTVTKVIVIIVIIVIVILVLVVLFKSNKKSKKGKKGKKRR